MTGGDNAIDIRRLCVTYREGARPALQGLSLSLRRGEVLLVMGASGAGKSTLVKALARIVPCFQAATVEGEIALLDRSIGQCAVGDLAGTTGVIFQDFEAQLFSTNVLCEVAFAMEQLGASPEVMPERAARALASVGLRGFSERDPATLSGGEKQRLAMAGLLALDPPILLLDEPTTDLDPRGREEVMRILSRLAGGGRTIVLVEHEIAAAAIADRILLLRGGQAVACAPPRELLPRVELFEECGVRAHDLARLLCGLNVPPALWADELIRSDSTTMCRTVKDRLVDAGYPETLRMKADEPLRGREAVPRLEMKSVSFEYTEGKRALMDVSLALLDGDFVAVIGENGSGKTTLSKHLNGLLRPSAGTVRLNGRDLAGLAPHEIAAEVGFVFQDPDHQLFSASVVDEVAFGPRNLGLGETEVSRRCEEALAAVGLEDRADSDPFLLDKGERQRLAVASVLSLEPSVIILDEPTTGLDYREQRKMMDLLRRLNRAGTTVVIVTHSPWLVAEWVTRVVLMSDGRLVWDGSLRSLFEEPERLAHGAFRVPDVTTFSRLFGVTALSVEELATMLRASDGS